MLKCHVIGLTKPSHNTWLIENTIDEPEQRSAKKATVNWPAMVHTILNNAYLQTIHEPHLMQLPVNSSQLLAQNGYIAQPAFCIQSSPYLQLLHLLLRLHPHNTALSIVVVIIVIVSRSVLVGIRPWCV